jgi:hypothetical protein
MVISQVAPSLFYAKRPRTTNAKVELLARPNSAKSLSKMGHIGAGPGKRVE